MFVCKYVFSARVCARVGFLGICVRVRLCVSRFFRFVCVCVYARKYVFSARVCVESVFFAKRRFFL